MVIGHYSNQGQPKSGRAAHEFHNAWNRGTLGQALDLDADSFDIRTVRYTNFTIFDASWINLPNFQSVMTPVHAELQATLQFRTGCSCMFASQKPVVVAEDEPLLRMLAVESLTNAGFTVIEAAHADEAMAVIRAENGQVMALFTDVEMPGTYNGLELAQLVCAQWPHVAVVVTSGNHVLSNEELPSGGVFMTKPYKLEAIVAQLRSFMSLNHPDL